MNSALTSFGAGPRAVPGTNTPKGFMAAARRRLPSAPLSKTIVLSATAFAVIATRMLWLVLPPEEPLIDMPAPSPPPLLASALQARHLFGNDTEAAPGFERRIDLRLMGTVAGEGVALIAADGKAPSAYRVGANIAPGVRLAAIGARMAEIDRHGVKESLPLSASHPSAQRR